MPGSHSSITVTHPQRQSVRHAEVLQASIFQLSHPGRGLRWSSWPANFFGPRSQQTVDDGHNTVCSEHHKAQCTGSRNVSSTRRKVLAYLPRPSGPIAYVTRVQLPINCDRPFYTMAVSIENMKSETVACAFFSHWISRFKPPLRIITDQSRQFETSLLGKLHALMGSTRIRTTAYHPQTNGLVVRFHKHKKSAWIGRLGHAPIHSHAGHQNSLEGEYNCYNGTEGVQRNNTCARELLIERRSTVAHEPEI